MEPTCGAAGSETVTCTACGAVTGVTELRATGAHTYVNGVCTVCGAADPNFVTPPPTNSVSSNTTTTEPPTTEPAGSVPAA